MKKLTNNKPEVNEELRDLVSTTIESVKEGLKGKNCGVVGQMEFEIAVIKTKEAKGGFRFLIVDASGKYAKEKISKIKFNVIGNDTEIARKLGANW